MPSCSIIVPVFNKASVTRQCLNALTRSIEVGDSQIIVVDDGSRDQTPQLLRTYGDRITVVTHPTNLGFARACNDGALRATGDYLMFLNNDTLPQRGWLTTLLRYAEAHPQVGVVGCKLVYPDETIQHAGVTITLQGVPNHIYGGFPAEHPAVNKSRRFQAVTGAAMLVRRAAFEEVGGFDVAFHNYYEDVDLCLRLGERGYETHYCHESVIYHLQSLSRTDQAALESLQRAYREVIPAFRARWGRRIQPDELAYYVEDGLLGIQPLHPYPVQLSVSPLLATIEQEGRIHAQDRLVSEQIQRAYRLMLDNTRLTSRVQDLELHLLGSGGEEMATSGAAAGGPLRTWPELRTQASLFDIRNAVAGLYLQGAGIEIGALHSPLTVPPTATVQYVDRMSVAELRQQYPELDAVDLVEADIVDDAESLITVPDASQDFVIANHYLEHCENPIQAMLTIARVVRPGGMAYLAIPDKRFTFDHRREITPFSHLERDYREGPAWSRRAHFEDWVHVGEDVSTRGMSVERLMAMDYSIHFHVWTQTELLELFARLRTEYGLPMTVECMVMNQIEAIFVLKKDT